MGQTLAQINCCAASDQDEFEVKNLHAMSNSSSRSGANGKAHGGSSIVGGQSNTTMELGGMVAMAGASDMTKNSSQAQVGAATQSKKILQFRLFKSLKDVGNFNAKYQVGKVLGKGSFGEVRECVDVRTGVTCAIKIVNKSHIGQHQVLVNLMEQELEVLQQTDHPHMVRVFELLQDDSKFYIVTELVTGGELYDHIIKVKRLDERAAADVIKQLLLALNYMHSQNVAHRDIKPENVLLAPEESSQPGKLNIKLTDFGFACFYSPERGLKQVLGSPLYMAPEIVREEHYDKSVDIWSVGVIAHILLSGCPPFYGKTKQDIYRSIVSDLPKFGKVRSQLSPESIQFVLKCLSKDPSRRYTAQQLLDHPWLQDNCPPGEVDEEAANEIIQDMAAFRKQNVFQTGVVSLLTALKVQSSELVNMKNMFLQLDASNDGFLTVDELQRGMDQVLGVLRSGSQDWNELIHQLDTNHDGKIDYGEFITAAVNRARLLNEKNLRIAFNLFDKDGNGQISKEELRAVFHGAVNQTALEDGDENLWQQIMSEVDRNNDNLISYAEFNDAMIEVITHRSSNLTPRTNRSARPQ